MTEVGNHIMNTNMPQILFAAVNFFVLVFVLYKLLGKPVRQLLDTRQAELQTARERAEAARQEALKQKQLIQESLSKADAKAQEIITQAQKVSEIKKKNLIQLGKEEAEKIQLATKEEIRYELEKAKEELRSDIAKMSVLAAGRLLQQSMDEKDHEALINDFIREVGQIK